MTGEDRVQIYTCKVCFQQYAQVYPDACVNCGTEGRIEPTHTRPRKSK